MKYEFLGDATTVADLVRLLHENAINEDAIVSACGAHAHVIAQYDDKGNATHIIIDDDDYSDDWNDYVTESEEIMFATLERKCPMCGQVTEIKIPRELEAAVDEYMLGFGYIQDIPLPANEREFIKTGYCMSCQKLLFG